MCDARFNPATKRLSSTSVYLLSLLLWLFSWLLALAHSRLRHHPHPTNLYLTKFYDSKTRWENTFWAGAWPPFRSLTATSLILTGFLRCSENIQVYKYMLNCKLNSTNGGTFSNSAEKMILMFFLFQRA